MWQEPLLSLAADTDLVLALVSSCFLSREKDTAKQKIFVLLPPKNVIFKVHQIEV